MSEPKMWVIYDARACGCMDGNIPDEASVFVACESHKEALDYCGEYGDCACFSYEEGPIDSKDGIRTLINCDWVFDWYVEHGLNDGLCKFPNKFKRG